MTEQPDPPAVIHNDPGDPGDLAGYLEPDPPIGCLNLVAGPDAEADEFSYEERERTGRNAGLTIEPTLPATATEVEVECVYDNGCGKPEGECAVTCKAVLDAVANTIGKQRAADPNDWPSRRTGLRDQLAAALYERERPPRDPAWADAYAMDREVFEPMADTVLAVLYREWPWLRAEAEDAWTPPPPGSTREQLPDHLLALLDIPAYTSTACETAGLLSREMVKRTRQRIELGEHCDRLHERCRRNQKFTGALCACFCHDGQAAPAPAATEATDRVTNLYESWLAAGTPPLGVPLARWWDRRLAELRDAIRADAEQSARTAGNNPPTGNNAKEN